MMKRKPRRCVRYHLSGKPESAVSHYSKGEPLSADEIAELDASVSKERDSFADTDSKYRGDLIRFQGIFGKYIPKLKEDEDATMRLYGRISDSLFTNPPETINRSTFDGDMKRFRRAITDLANSPLWATKSMIATIAAKKEKHNRVDMGVCDVYDFLLTLQDMADYDRILPNVLDEIEKCAREAAYYVPDRRNINWEAVHAVDRLRGFWEGWTETQAPRRGLNPESPFANYLRDAFEFFNIQGDPVSAFKRWVALEDSEPHTWK